MIAAFGAVYLIWGSTYLAIRFAIETLPPFMMAAVRFAVAGALLYGWTRMRGAPAPSRRNWLDMAVVGALLLCGGNGAVVWAEQTVPSGIAALVVACVPVWMVLFDWIGPDRRRPTLRVSAGLLLGIVGLLVLIGPGALAGSGDLHLAGVGVLVLGSASWAAGSIYARHARVGQRPWMMTGMQMLAGAALLTLVSLISGEFAALNPAGISLLSMGALVYLIIFGAIVAYSAYIWLLKVSTPAHVSTYAFVNPLVAVFLGWLFAAEPITAATLAAAAIIVAGVAMVTLGAPRGASAQSR